MLTSQPIRPICSECLRLPARPNGRSALGYQRWHTLCNSCANLRYKKQPQKQQVCSKCGFQSVDGCQMCLVNGQTICLNCNALRLKDIRPHSELTVDATVNWLDIRL